VFAAGFLDESSGRGATWRGLRSKNLPEVRERIVHGGFVSAGADVVVELEAACEAFGVLFFGGGSAAVMDVTSRKAGRSAGLKRIVDSDAKCGR